jgi:hypothetical protein
MKLIANTGNQKQPKYSNPGTKAFIFPVRTDTLIKGSFDAGGAH